MPWADAVDVDTLHCAFETMQSLARHGEWSAGPVPTLDRFLRAVRSGKYRDMAVADFAAMEPMNASARRLGARTAAAAYPPDDRPRGGEDLASVRRLRKRDTVASPVLVAMVDVEGGSPAKGGRKSGRRAPVLLDGMHRLVAAAIDGRPARVCFVSL